MGLLDSLGRGLSAAGYAAADIYKQKSLDEDRAALENERMARQEEFIKAREARGEERQIAAEGRKEQSQIAAEKRALDNIGLEATAKAKALSSPEVLEATSKIFENQKTAEIKAFIKQNSDPEYLSALRKKSEAERDPAARAENMMKIKLAEIQVKGAQMELDKRVETENLLKKANDKSLSPAERAQAREDYQLRSNKDADRWEILKTKDAMGVEQIVGKHNKTTGEMETWDANKGVFVKAGPKYQAVASEEELLKLPKGTPAILPSGKVAISPGIEQAPPSKPNSILASAPTSQPSYDKWVEAKKMRDTILSQAEKMSPSAKEQFLESRLPEIEQRIEFNSKYKTY